MLCLIDLLPQGNCCFEVTLELMIVRCVTRRAVPGEGAGTGYKAASLIHDRRWSSVPYPAALTLCCRHNNCLLQHIRPGHLDD